jgi:hypothetical protein
MTGCTNLSGSLHALLDMRARPPNGVLCPSNGVVDEAAELHLTGAWASCRPCLDR